MSNRSLLEFNHDYCPRDVAGEVNLGNSLRHYMRTADPDFLPPGVVRKHYRHHSDPDPMVLLDQLAGDLRAAQKREKVLVAALREARELAALVAKNDDAGDRDSCADCRSAYCDEFGCLPALLERIDAALAKAATP